MKNVLLLLAIIALSSCEQETTNYKDPIRGTWTSENITLVIDNTITVITNDSVYTANYEYYEFYETEDCSELTILPKSRNPNAQVFKIVQKGDYSFKAYSLPDTINLLSFIKINSI